MTLRDWFAGQAMWCLLADTTDGESTRESIAREAYLQADAMIEERARRAKEKQP